MCFHMYSSNQVFTVKVLEHTRQQGKLVSSEIDTHWRSDQNVMVC